MNGFVVSTIMNREDRAFKEFVNKVARFTYDSSLEMKNTDNFSCLLASELSCLKTCTNFVLHDKYKSILLIKNQTNCAPSSILESMRRENITFQNILRVIPLDLILKTTQITESSDEGMKSITEMIGKYRFGNSYKIMFEGRLAPDIKEKMFRIILPKIQARVDLNNFEDVVVVEAFKSVVGISIVKRDPHGFNFSEKQIAESQNIDS